MQSVGAAQFAGRVQGAQPLVFRHPVSSDLVATATPVATRSRSRRLGPIHHQCRGRICHRERSKAISRESSHVTRGSLLGCANKKEETICSDLPEGEQQLSFSAGRQGQRQCPDVKSDRAAYLPFVRRTLLVPRQHRPQRSLEQANRDLYCLRPAKPTKTSWTL
jgi:hypothetical protein